MLMTVTLCSWVFTPKIITHSRTEKGMGLSLTRLTLKPSPSNLDFFAKIWKRAKMNSRLIGLGLSDNLSSPVRAKMEYCKSHDHFACRVMDFSPTRIPSSSITSHHSQPTSSFVGQEVLPFCRCTVSVFYSPSQQGECVCVCVCVCMDMYMQR